MKALAVAAILLTVAAAEAAESPLQATDRTIGTPTVVVRRFEGLRLDACLSLLERAAEEDPGPGTDRKPPARFRCFVQPSSVPAGLAIPLPDGARALGVKPPPEESGAKARCRIRVSVAADGIAVETQPGRQTSYAFTEKDAVRCLEEHWKSHSLEKHTFEVPLLLVPEKK